jgi:transcriptional regulator with XRE-family HTH domain
MDSEKLKYQLGSNIAAHRKRFGLTQAALAEKLNFSDKAVSKWERGESIPDVVTLARLAELFDVPMDVLVRDKDELPKDIGSVERAMERAVEKTLKRKANKKIIQNLSSLLVWFVALLTYVILATVNMSNAWVGFIYALPVNCIVLISLRSAWHDYRANILLISILSWGCLLSIHISLLAYLNLNVWMIYLLGIPGQLAIFLWSRLFRLPEEKENG